MYFFNFKQLVTTTFLLFLLNACSVKKPSAITINSRVNKLNNLIIGLSPNINKKEALNMAKNSINYSFALAKEYKTVSLPWVQNTLVNIGLKERGLCYEWTEDLLKYLVAQNYQTLDFHAVGANIGYLNEHNALSVSAKGESMEDSILLDAWRNSGNLYFRKINEDEKYEWKERKGIYGILPQ